jgi:hypothetical protein
VVLGVVHPWNKVNIRAKPTRDVVFSFFNPLVVDFILVGYNIIL